MFEIAGPDIQVYNSSSSQAPIKISIFFSATAALSPGISLFSIIGPA